MEPSATLEKIELKPTKPTIVTPHADKQVIPLLDKFYRHEQWDKMMGLCVSRAVDFLNSFPNPGLDGGDIAHLYYASKVYEAKGHKDRSAVCLKALFSLEPFQSYLPDTYQEYVSIGANEYRALSDVVGIDYLNKLQVTDLFKKSSDSESKSGCFIATACYGSYDAPDVLVLRQFRDVVLLNSVAGRIFVRFYYSVSPPIAQFMESREKLKKWVRYCLINRIVKKIEKG